MSYNITIDTKANLFLKKLAKTAPKDFEKIDNFLLRLEKYPRAFKIA